MRTMPKVTVGAIIHRDVNNKPDILLTKRNVEPFKGYWCLPGGHIELNEDAISAVIREVGEETGLIFAPCFMNYQDEIFPERGTHNVVLLFHGTASGDGKPDPVEVSEMDWFTADEVLNMDLAFSHKEAVKMFLGSMP